ncbi:MAG: hypothetical protein JWO85_2591 [Candidatus Eremiobacteraeota bacterium]|nr:hypothetical protein [Candidatus Eremiobacteraeota bacterium]
MDAFAGLLRPLHIVAASAWFGSALIFHGFVEPTAAALGKSAEPFFLRFLSGPFRTAISLAAVVTIAAGMGMYWHDSSGFTNGWIFSATGLSYTTGGVAALLALVIALTVTGPNTLKLGALEREFNANGWNLGDADLQRLHRAKRRLQYGGRIGTGLLFVALVAMVVARAL